MFGVGFIQGFLLSSLIHDSGCSEENRKKNIVDRHKRHNSFLDEIKGLNKTVFTSKDVADYLGVRTQDVVGRLTSMVKDGFLTVEVGEDELGRGPVKKYAVR